MYHPQFLDLIWFYIDIFKIVEDNVYPLTLLERTGNILHKYLLIFPMDVKIANVATQP